METNSRRRLLQGLAASAACAAVARPIWAGSYPDRAIRLIVAAAPGGGTDAMARLIAPTLAARLGQPCVVDNHAGAGGRVAAGMVVNAASDGYTLLITPSDPVVIGPLTEQAPYDPQRDLMPVSLLTRFSSALVINPKVGPRTTAELISHAKQNPGKLNFSSNGLGSSNHLAGELFKKLAGVDIVHVPYGGSGPSLSAAISGEVQLAFVAPQNVVGHRSGEAVRILGIGSRTRTEAFRDFPTLGESVPGYLFENWIGVLSPKGTDPNVIARLQPALADAVMQGPARARLVGEGQEVVGSKPTEFTTKIRSDLETYGELLDQVGLRKGRKAEKNTP